MTMRKDDGLAKPFDVPDFSESGPIEFTTRHRCVDCEILSPRVETNHTLISSRYGWRLHREVSFATGDTTYEWRCPNCWTLFRTNRTSS